MKFDPNIAMTCRKCLMEYFPGRSRSEKFCSKKCEKEYKALQNNPEDQSSELATGKRGIIGNRKMNYMNRKFTSNKSTKIRERDGYSCFVCGKDCDLEVHHVIPRTEGGSHDDQNLISLCKSCHRAIESGNVSRSMRTCSKNAVKEVIRRIGE